MASPREIFRVVLQAIAKVDESGVPIFDGAFLPADEPRTIVLSYTDRKGNTTTREVEPLSMRENGTKLYVIDPAKKGQRKKDGTIDTGLRGFIVGRIGSIQLGHGTYFPDEPLEPNSVPNPSSL